MSGHRAANSSRFVVSPNRRAYLGRVDGATMRDENASNKHLTLP